MERENEIDVNGLKFRVHPVMTNMVLIVVVSW